jgi:hypothetical protein
MAEEGASWIDVGGESTRPGATPVPEDEEQARVVPVIQGLRRRLSPSIRISIDTYKAGTARAAVKAGASVVNDISGGQLDPEIGLVGLGCPVRSRHLLKCFPANAFGLLVSRSHIPDQAARPPGRATELRWRSRARGPSS